MTTTYEWDIELVTADEHEDILDHNHRASLSEYGLDEVIRAINHDTEPGGNFTRLVLVRDKRDRDDNLDRSWAYVTDDGKMPEMFTDANDVPVAKVPARFMQEFSR